MNPTKCKFGRLSTDFPGHHNTRARAVPLSSEVAVVADFPQPCTTGVDGEFKGNATKDAVAWSEETVKAFSDREGVLAAATMLAHPFLDAPITLMADASDYDYGSTNT